MAVLPPCRPSPYVSLERYEILRYIMVLKKDKSKTPIEYFQCPKLFQILWKYGVIDQS